MYNQNVCVGIMETWSSTTAFQLGEFLKIIWLHLGENIFFIWANVFSNTHLSSGRIIIQAKQIQVSVLLDTLYAS